MGVPQTLPANFDGFDKAPATLPADFSQWDQPKQPSAASRLGTNFLSGLGVTSNDDAKNFFRHPLDTVIKSFEAQGELAKKARAAYDKGDYMGALQHGLNYLVPFVGQQTDQAGEQLKQGDIAGGVGRTLGAAAPIVAGSPEVQSAAGDVASAAADTAGKALQVARRITPKQVAQGVGGVSGAGLGHGALSVPGAYYGVKGAGNLAEGILGKERANAPIGLPSRVAGGPASAPEFTAPATEVESPAASAVPAAQSPAAAPAATSPESAAPAATPQPTRATLSNLKQQINDSLGGKTDYEMAGGKPLEKGKPIAARPQTNLKQQIADAAEKPAAQTPRAPLTDLQKQIATAANPLPDGFTATPDSSLLKGYKYDPAKQQFSAVLNDGASYMHGEVSPEQVKAFEDADSQGSAWTKKIKQGPGTVLMEKNGVPVRKAARTIVTDPETGGPEFSDVIAAKQAAAQATPAADDDLTSQLEQSLAAARARKGATR
jgi:hypothetical protein